MTAHREWTELAASAAQLSESRFLKIVELFERVRDQPGIAEAMRIIRPRLAELRPPRRITPLRLFFLPVEDLLDDIGRYQRRLSRVSRATLEPCWRIIVDGLGEKKIARITKTLERTDSQDATAVIRAGETFWREGAKVLGDALDEAFASQKDRVRLFGRDDDVLRQVSVIVAVTEIAETVESVKASLPDRPIQSLAEFHVDALRKAIQQLAADGLAKVTPFLLVLSARMLRPGDLLEVLANTRLEGYQTEKDDVAREVGVFALENLLRQSDEVPGLMRQGLLAADVATLAERLLDGFDSMSATLQRADQRRMVQRVDRARSVISDAIMARVVVPADREMLGHIFEPAEKGLTFLKVAPDAMPGADEINKAEDFARAFRRCARIAPLVGLRPQVQDKAAEICRTVQRAAVELSDATRPGPRNAVLDRGAVDEQFVALLRLVEIVAGPDEAERLLVDWEERLDAAGSGRVPYREMEP